MEIKPSTWVLLGGSVVLLISVFLPWFSVGEGDFSLSASGLSGLPGGDWFGIFSLLIALAVGGVTAVSTFAAGVNLPDDVLGFRQSQIFLMLSSSVVLMVLGYILTSSEIGVGAFLALFASIAMTVGAVLASREEPTARASSTPPTPF